MAPIARVLAVCAILVQAALGSNDTSQRSKAFTPPPVPSLAQLALLTPAPNGCAHITDRGLCLSSKDAGSQANWEGYRLAGEACVWCGGAQCTDRSADKCMPYDLLMNGQGKYYTTFYAVYDFKVAAFVESRRMALNSSWDATCLCTTNAGCHTLSDQFNCLSSKDGRPEGVISGRQVAGQPCVWCAGGRCNSGSAALCEPYDVQMNGMFVENFAKDHYKVAGCQGGKLKSIIQLAPGVSKPTFPLDPPSQAARSCLKNELAGCFAIKDRLSCLSSIDGSTVRSFGSIDGGLKVQGQPCVWCGGGPCTTDGPLASSLCLPFDYLARGAGRAFRSVNTAALTVAECAMSVEKNKFDFGDMSCLLLRTIGCNKITDFKTCTSSTDGRPYSFVAGFKAKGQPCVWCGGGACSEQNSNLCEPYDFAVNGIGHAFNLANEFAAYSVASCSPNGIPGPRALPNFYELHGTPQIVDCGFPNPVWQKVGQVCGFCKALVPKIQERYPTCGDYCSKNGGLNCAGASLSTLRTCEAAKAVTCSYQFALEENALCECLPKPAPTALARDFPRPADKHLECLDLAKNGCTAVTDKLSCLGSKDASGVKIYRTVAVDGEPCVWCGAGPAGVAGGACTSDSNATCVPYDWMARGEGVVYAYRQQASTILAVAQCNVPDRNFGNTGCLKRQIKGCNTLKDKGTCLSSLDSRKEHQIAGFMIEGQPCVWCGDTRCNSNSEDMCAPHDFAIHGAGQAFVTDLAVGRYTTAACENGKPVPHELPSASTNAGVLMTVNCGVPNPTWTSVSKTCDWCKVQVAAEAMPMFQNCSSYCAAQVGNLGCSKAWTSFKHSCDSQAATTCDYNFKAGENALCECPAGSKWESKVAPTQSAQMTPVVIDTLAPPVEVTAAPFPKVPEVLTNIGKDCWEACNQLSGLCSFCGKGNACCRHNTTGEGSQPKECRDIPTYLTWHHECVIPVHHVTPKEAAARAGAQAAAAVAAAGGSAAQRVKAAGDAAGAAAIRAGAEAEAAQDAFASAAIVARETAMSGPEALDAAKRAAAKAAAKANQSPAAVAEAVVVGVEDAAEQAGVQAAMLAKVDGKSVQDQTVAAAKEAAYAAFDLQQPEPVAMESARASAMKVATDAGQHVYQAEETANAAVTALMLAEQGTNSALRHAFADCYAQCGNKPGMCNGFCGIGSACCRVSGGTVVPLECQKITTYKTGHFECVVPQQATPTLVGVVPVSGDDSGPAMDVQAQKGNQDTTGGTQPTSEHAGQGGFGTASFFLIGGGVAAAFLAAGLVLYLLSSLRASRRSKRGARMEEEEEEEEEDSDEGTDLEFHAEEEDSDEGADLEFHAPSVTPQFAPNGGKGGGKGGAPAARYPHLPYQQGRSLYDQIDANHQGFDERPDWLQGGRSTGPARPMQAQPMQYARAPPPMQQGAQPMQSLFDREDRNNDGVINRQEWNLAYGGTRPYPH
ncbi:unnamed protein product [Polarella glacialis]|uniref:EF-hand domain-containing protein n=1 Tax=Polarella glacialis TaxID=89957 RepID=A0A813FYS3_POLGL|nr:unnamed protein product [Polarella glacialis]CAE8656670.1 unnamed protein product [Polarella glacialis]